MKHEASGIEKSWNQFVKDAGGSFLQSFEWGALQEQLENRIERVRGTNFQALAIKRKLPFGMRYLYVPRGPIFSKSNFTEADLNYFISSLKEKIHSGDQPIFLRIEPELLDTPACADMLQRVGFRHVESIQPKETIILDLKKKDEELLATMDHDTRYAIRAANRRGVLVTRARTAEEKKVAFSSFWKVFHETNERHGLAAYQQTYYEEVARLVGDCVSEIFLAYVNAKPIAAALIVQFGTRATYLFAGSSEGFGRFNAPTLLLWEAMRAAKGERCAEFDLWGMSRNNPKWEGITSFKKSFGGREIRYLGAWDLPFDKIRYNIYRLTRVLRRGFP